MSNSRGILRGKRGASMMFVLAVMLLLMIAAGSALTAAFSNFGEAVKKREISQLDLFVNSMELTLKAVLEQTGDTVIAETDTVFVNMNTLTGWILQDVYRKANTGGSMQVATGSSILAVNIPGTWGATYTSITVDYRLVGVQLTRYVPYEEVWGLTFGQIGVDEDDNPIFGSVFGIVEVILRRPQELSINGGTVTITVTAEHGDFTVRSATTYIYSGGWIREVTDETNDHDGPLRMMINELGGWTFERHERLDV